MADRWIVAAIYRVARLSLTVLRDERIIAMAQHRFDGRPRTREAFAEHLATLAADYGAHRIIVEPGTVLEAAARLTGRAIGTMTIRQAATLLSVDGRQRDLCQAVVNQYPQLRRHIRMLPGDRIAPSDRRGETALLSVALGLAFQKTAKQQLYL